MFNQNDELKIKLKVIKYFNEPIVCIRLNSSYTTLIIYLPEPSYNSCADEQVEDANESLRRHR